MMNSLQLNMLYWTKNRLFTLNFDQTLEKIQEIQQGIQRGLEQMYFWQRLNLGKRRYSKVDWNIFKQKAEEYQQDCYEDMAECESHLQRLFKKVEDQICIINQLKMHYQNDNSKGMAFKRSKSVKKLWKKYLIQRQQQFNGNQIQKHSEKGIGKGLNNSSKVRDLKIAVLERDFANLRLPKIKEMIVLRQKSIIQLPMKDDHSVLNQLQTLYSKFQKDQKQVETFINNNRTLMDEFRNQIEYETGRKRNYARAANCEAPDWDSE